MHDTNLHGVNPADQTSFPDCFVLEGVNSFLGRNYETNGRVWNGAAVETLPVMIARRILAYFLSI